MTVGTERCPPPGGNGGGGIARAERDRPAVPWQDRVIVPRRARPVAPASGATTAFRAGAHTGAAGNHGATFGHSLAALDTRLRYNLRDAGGGRLPTALECDVTGLLLAWRQGDESALDALMPLVYAELHHLAHRHLHARSPEPALQTTALVHEAYIRLLGSSRVSWQNRAHFFALSAQLMRRVLVDAIRARRSLKRGGLSPHVSLQGDESLGPLPRRDLVALDEALTGLAQLDPRKAKVVELRYFGGLTADESAEVLGVSRATVERDWRMAKLWLTRQLKGSPA